MGALSDLELFVLVLVAIRNETLYDLYTYDNVPNVIHVAPDPRNEARNPTRNGSYTRSAVVECVRRMAAATINAARIGRYPAGFIEMEAPLWE